MKKGLKITLIILGVVIGIVVLDTLQALLFDNSPIIKIRENNDGGSIDYIDKGIFVNHYYCVNKEENTVFKNVKYSCPIIDSEELTDNLDKELLSCLESQLGGYLVTETDNLIELPLSEIKSSDKEKIAYYKGVYASNHPNNIFIMVYPENGTYESSVMKDFDKYFYNKFSVYQKYESPLTPTIYIHNQDNDVDFKDIVNKCVISNNTEDGKAIPNNTLDKVNNTTKIVIKSNQKELGTISDKDKLDEILSAIKSSKKYGENCLADGHAFDFEMYDNDNKLIDTIYVWGDGNRLIPKSMNGCYYSISNDIDLRQIIEEETDYIFYNILDYRDNDNQQEQVIYKDDKNSYYIKSDDVNEMLIKFMLNNQTMTLKYALENEYISAEKVSDEYPDVLIKK